MDDYRAGSPCDHRLDGLELLHRLSLCDSVHYMPTDADFTGKAAAEPPSALPYSWDEEADACDPSMYDPSLFSPSTSQPASPTRPAFTLSGVERDKPLPPPPSVYRTSPPSTPKLTPASTPSSSPRVSMSNSSSPSQPLPRSRPPSANMSAARSLQHHAAFPSISSTLSLLEERSSESAKRSGVLVQPDDDHASSEGTVIAHPPVRKSSIEMLRSMEAETKRIRPVLGLSMSTSSPQLRTLAELANVPASPISVSSTHSISHKPSLVSLTPSVSSPLAMNSVLLPPATLEEETIPSNSRWSIDSMDPRSEGRPTVSAPATPPSPPVKPKRSRLLSFISRGRAGSLGKRSDTVPSTPVTAEHPDISLLSPADTISSPASASTLSLALSSRRTSRSGTYPPPLSVSTSTSTMSTTSSVSTLPTPADSQPDVALDPFCPASPTFAPASYLPEPPAAEPESFVDFDDDEPEKPTLPLPSPKQPTASFFLPEPEPTNFLSALARRRVRRRKKKLVVTCLSTEALPEGEANAELAAFRRDRDLRRRHDAIMKWCETFGEVRRFERKPDGSLHVYWRDWEVADMVCRVSAQVHIKGVGRVTLAWYYVN